MDKLIVTDNTGERIEITWDGERFALPHWNKVNSRSESLILNPREAAIVAGFINKIIFGNKEV